ncbi:MAG: S46 family peptidase [Prolixibacteraceae bacterium]|nr:S46 family peptidase [Prolixibacteraceae bacterium]
MKKFFLFIQVFLLCVVSLSAHEGMWIPTLLKKYNIEEMQQMGFRLTAEDIYDINNVSMKDAVVIFGGGCTGEMISPDGLLITNHHCGYSQVQMHSSVENDYLTHGFWAMNRNEELPNPGLSVSFLERMEDVTDKVLENTQNLSDAAELEAQKKNNIAEIEKEARENGKYRVQVKPLFYGNQYFLYVHKVYTDVRLVGAPPSAIGKFGGDTDNWTWPRHTGDFALFRVYAGKDNEPAQFSEENVPYKPGKFFPISLQGVQPGDFTMVFGNPGTTQQYITSNAVDLIMTQRNPDRIALRDIKLEILNRHTKDNAKVRIQYASKHASISNSWKRWQGEILGLKRLDAVQKKKEFEKSFENWARRQGTWDSQYKDMFGHFGEIYTAYAPLAKASDYYSEVVWSGAEIFLVASYINSFFNQMERDGEITENMQVTINRLLDGFLKNFHQPIDEELFMSLLPRLAENVENQFLPAALSDVLNKYVGDKLIEKFYRKSILTDYGKLTEIFASNSQKQITKLLKDPVFALYRELLTHYNKTVGAPIKALELDIESEMKQYMNGVMQFKEGQALYPDANFTLRVSYGKVEGFEPRDGIEYKHYTTLEGIIEKGNPDIYDYDVPARLQELYNNRDYGVYGLNDAMPVCFIASNHTTGGNSGSPVVNGDGHLTGINFDRCWEGTMSDIMFDPERCRNIALDIRYALFIIDKFAGAGYLLDEMEIVR